MVLKPLCRGLAMKYYNDETGYEDCTFLEKWREHHLSDYFFFIDNNTRREVYRDGSFEIIYRGEDGSFWSGYGKKLQFNLG